MIFPSFLRIGIVTNMDIFKIDDSGNQFPQITGGLESNFVKILSEGLHFRYSVHIPDDKEWGRLNEEGNWTGVIGLVSTNQADIGLSKIGISYQKLAAVDFSYPYSIERVTFATQPPGLISKETALLLPFSWGLWISLLLCLIFVAFVLKLILRNAYTLQYIFLYVIGCIFMKAKGIKSEKSAERIFVSAWLFTSMLLSYSYMAVLLSFLTVPLKEQPVDNKFRLKDVLDQGTYKCVTPSGSFVLKTLLTSYEPTEVSIAAHIEKNNWLIQPTKKALVDSLSDVKVAAINPRNHFRILLPDQIQMANDYFSLLFWGIAINKNFCCKKALDKMVRRIIEAGLYQKSEDYFYFESQLKYSKIVPSEDMSDIALKLRDVIGAFIFLAMGYFLALISLIIERLFDRKKFQKL